MRYMQLFFKPTLLTVSSHISKSAIVDQFDIDTLQNAAFCQYDKS